MTHMARQRSSPEDPQQRIYPNKCRDTTFGEDLQKSRIPANVVADQMVVAEFLQELSDRRKENLDLKFRELNMAPSRVFEGKLAIVTGASRSMSAKSNSLSSEVYLPRRRLTVHQALVPRSQHTSRLVVPM
jgi:hypothetical protein